MHVVETTEELNLGPNGVFTVGQYLCDDHDTARFMLLTGGGKLKIRPFRGDDAPLTSRDWNGKKILILRPGRFGDLIRLTPVLRAIKNIWPTCTLCVSAHPLYRDVLLGLSYVDGFVHYPAPIETVEGFDCVKTLEVMAGFGEAEKTTHISDLFAGRLGLELGPVKHPDYAMTQDEREWVAEQFPRHPKRKRVVIQVQSDSPARDYPHMMPVIKKLHGRNWDIVLVGRPGQINGKSMERLRNSTLENLTFRQSAAILTTSDIFLGPDSSMLHVAAALNLPAVGLFGSFPAKLRVGNDPNIYVLRGRESICPIAPCSYSAPAGGFPFPAVGPCARSHVCDVLAFIEPDQVVSKIEQIAGRSTENG